MKVFIISTTIFRSPRRRYGGIEQLVWSFAVELCKQGHEVGVAAPIGSRFPKGVNHVETVDLSTQAGFDKEHLAYYWYNPYLRDYEVIHDFSHRHIASMTSVGPFLNMVWFDPYLMKPPMPKYNIVALSEWQAERFQRIYGQQARYVETICANSKKYGFRKKRGERYLFIGKMSREKGALEAISICKKMGVPLDVVGGKGVRTDPEDYMNLVIDSCDDRQIRWYGNVSNEVKIKLMQRAKALLYPVQYTEAHSHKIAEALMCGCPVIVYNMGAMGEIVEDGVTGFVVKDEGEFMEAMKKVDEIDPRECRKVAVRRWSRKNVIKGYIPVYEEVAEGKKW